MTASFNRRRRRNRSNEAAIAFWQKMSAESRKHGGKLPEFISTHPADERRIAALQAEMPQVMPIYEQARQHP